MSEMLNVARVVKHTASGEDTELTLGKLYAFSPIVNVTYTLVRGDEVTISFDLMTTSKEANGHHPWSEMMFTVPRSDEKDGVIIEVLLVSSKDPSSQCDKIIRVCSNDEDTRRAFTRIETWETPFVKAGNMVYCIQAKKTRLLVETYAWERLQGQSTFSYHQPPEWKQGLPWRNDLQTWKFLSLENAKLRRVPIIIRERVRATYKGGLASDIAYVDTKARVIYVLATSAQQKVNVVAMTYGCQYTMVPRFDSDDTEIKLTWYASTGSVHADIRAEGDEHPLHLSLSGLQRQESVAEFLLLESDEKRSFAAHEAVGGNEMIIRRMDFFNVHPVISHLLGYENYYKTFESCEELRESFDTYFRVLATYVNAKDNDVGQEVYEKFWADHMTYGPMYNWNVSKVSSFTNLFKDYVFPYHVFKLNLRGWKFPKKIEHIQGMFQNVQNVSEIVLPELCLAVNGSRKDTSDAVVCNMFKGSSIVRAEVELEYSNSVGLGRKALNIESMFENCRLLETIYLNIKTSNAIDVYMDSFAKDCPVLQRFCAFYHGKPHNVTVASKAFENCTDLQTVCFPRRSEFAVDFLGVSYFRNMFSNCTKLEILDVQLIFQRLGVFSNSMNKVEGMICGTTSAAKTLCTPSEMREDDDVTTIELSKHYHNSTKSVQSMLKNMVNPLHCRTPRDVKSTIVVIEQPK